MRALMLGVLISLVGCGVPTAPALPSQPSALHLLAVLDPDSTRQLLMVASINADRIADLTVGVEIRESDGRFRPVAQGVPVGSLTCSDRYGQALGQACLAFDLVVLPGRVYRVRAAASGFPSAVAVTEVPGDFSLTQVEALGAPPGTDRLRAGWTASAGGYRYLASYRTVTPYSCGFFCGQGWVTVTAGLGIDAVVPNAALSGPSGPFEFAVFALNQPLFDYLSSGTGGAFPVLPRQNVDGGFGLVGAWVRRARRISP